MTKPAITLVAAMARNRVIGAGGGMPWHLPADLAHFKAVTMGYPVVMGRKTFESIGKPLPGRRNIVISRRSLALPEGVEPADSLDAAVEQCGDIRRVMVIGGGEIYRLALPQAASMELTFVDAVVEGDTFFPEWPHDDWRLVSMEVRPADSSNSFRLTFCSLLREAAR